LKEFKIQSGKKEKGTYYSGFMTEKVKCGGRVIGSGGTRGNWNWAPTEKRRRRRRKCEIVFCVLN